MSKKPIGRIPTWSMFKESFSASYHENEESLDDLDNTGAAGDPDATEPTDVPTDTEAPIDEVPANEEATDDLSKVKTKILDIKETLEGSDDEFTKEDFVKFLDELSDCCEPVADDEDPAGDDSGEEGGEDAGAEGDDLGAPAGEDEGAAPTEELSESKKTGKKPTAGKLPVPETKAPAKHKKADVTGKPTTPKAAGTPKPGKK